MKECMPQSINYKKRKHSPLVLVIDDSNFMRNSMRNILEGIGCEVICASNGLEGVNLFKEVQPSIVLIDAIMPIMDGFTACSMIRRMETGRETLIFMITTQSEQEIVEKAYEVGFDDYWVKPIVTSVFVPRMEKIIKNYEFGRKVKTISRSATKIHNELIEASKLQTSLLPCIFKNDYISVNHIYSPFDKVSGDFIDYWWNENEKTLYGYVLDVAGHSISSAMQGFAIRMLFCQFFQGGKSGLSPSRILQFVNCEMFSSKQRDSMATAITFAINLKEKTLKYSSAGISPFYITSDKINKIKTAGYPLGYKRNADYSVEKMSLKDAKKITFASDGFSELLNSDKAITSKHDDVAAILIKILK